MKLFFPLSMQFPFLRSSPSTRNTHPVTLSAKCRTMKEVLDMRGFWKCWLLACRSYSFCAQFWSVPLGTWTGKKWTKMLQSGMQRRCREVVEETSLWASCILHGLQEYLRNKVHLPVLGAYAILFSCIS